MRIGWAAGAICAAGLITACTSGGAGAAWYRTPRAAVLHACGAYRVTLVEHFLGSLAMDWQTQAQAQSHRPTGVANVATLERSSSGFRVAKCVAGHSYAGLR